MDPLESLESHANGSYEVVGVGPSTADKVEIIVDKIKVQKWKHIPNKGSYEGENDTIEILGGNTQTAGGCRQA